MIQRYDFYYEEIGRSKEGEWVKYADHEKLEQENEELKNWMEERGHFDDCDLGNKPDNFDKRHYNCTCKLVELTEPLKESNENR